MKTCPKCKVGTEFYKDPRRADGLRRVCKECNRKASAVYRDAHPDKMRDNARIWNEKNPEKRAKINRAALLRRDYGMTLEEEAELTAKQNGRCAACGELPRGKKHESRLHVDHDHLTGKVRGLLCGRCNKAAGLLDDDPDKVRQLLQYLTASRASASMSHG